MKSPAFILFMITRCYERGSIDWLINSLYMKQWRTPKIGHSYAPASIESGDVGIWVTCDKNKEGLCTIELRDLFEEVRIPFIRD